MRVPGQALMRLIAATAELPVASIGSMNTLPRVVSAGALKK
jgi:hypothetical protein